MTTIDRLNYTPVFGLEAWSVRREFRKYVRQLVRARRDSERILAEVRRVAIH